MPEIIVASHAGFCFGVKRAVELAVKALAEGPHPVHTLGPIIHNPLEVARLEKLGLKMARSLAEIEGGTVIIRSHGAPRGIRESAVERGLRVVDATCPFVKKVEERVWQLAAEGYLVIIAGEADHPEVEALVSYAPGSSLVVGSADELEGHELPQKVGVVAQTTLSVSTLLDIASRCLLRAMEVRAFRTNCNSTVRMREEARKMAETVDVMVVVGGKNSANTRRLAETTRALGKTTFLVENADEVASLPIPPDARIGLTAGASTPPWVIDLVGEALRIRGGGRII